MTVGHDFVDELRELGLSELWDRWGGKSSLCAQLSAWGSSQMEDESALIPRRPRYLVWRTEFERMLRKAAEEQGVKLRSKLELPSEKFIVIDATGRSCQIARRREARRCTANTLVAMHGVGARGQLPRGYVVVQSDSEGWWFAASDRGLSTIMYLSARDARGGFNASTAAPSQPRAFKDLVGESRFLSTRSLASMSWLDPPSADNWFAVGEAVLALDPILGSGVAVAAQSARLLHDALRFEDPFSRYNASINSLIAKHRIARQRLYCRAAAFHEGSFWAQQVRV
jgi:flavin-dependent dehydrogenase